MNVGCGGCGGSRGREEYQQSPPTTESQTSDLTRVHEMKKVQALVARCKTNKRILANECEVFWEK